MVSLRLLITRMKPVVLSIHLGFFSPVYKWLTHYCVILRGTQSNNRVNQPKQSCPALNEQTVGIQKHLSFKKQNAYIVDCWNHGESSLPCDKMLVAHVSLSTLLYPVFSACYWEAWQEVGIFRCIWIYMEMWQSLSEHEIRLNENTESWCGSGGCCAQNSII